MNSLNAPSRDRPRQFITVFAILGSFVVNAISNIRPLNGESIGQISNTQFANVLITPANYAFAIWGVIYLGLIGFAAYQFLPPRQQHSELKRISYLLVLACVAQAAWVYLFLARLFALSVVAMVVILLCLIGIYQALDRGPARPFGRDRTPSPQDRWLLRIPFSVYLGWIAVATIVNVALALYSAGWTGWGLAPEVWTVLLLIVATGLGIVLLLQRQDIAFGLVLVWALLAIAVKRATIPLIALTAISLSAILVGLMIWVRLGSRRLGARS
ncbi:MAG: tryptophan-rich sensory protein [Leptolyngbyaceae cyanobacterium bins.349]|nr:tryptophan-rich sensory protein [Leptolyngbyaceae cyanobacterium bins.349]